LDWCSTQALTTRTQWASLRQPPFGVDRPDEAIDIRHAA
jgi:hypothetical protein